MTTPSRHNAGRIVGVFGLHGECKIDATRIGLDSLAVGVVVEASLPDGSQRELHVRSVRLHKGRPLAAFDGYADVDSAQNLVGTAIAVDRLDVTLRPGEYLDSDLVGCVVIDANGSDIGRVVAVDHYPAQDMLVVGATRALIPLVGAFVSLIDVAAKRIDVDLPPGLVDEREADVG